ncbi:MAG: hypothetical protein K6E87_04535 [bacterium]|nr:hypothetical protein [bacterium]
MKKFLLNISKRNILKIIIVFLVMLLMILFSSVKTVYAASNDGPLYEGSDFRIDGFDRSGTNIYIDVVSKKDRNGNYATHLDFQSCTGSLNGVSSTYSLTCETNLYSNNERYLINGLSLTSDMNFKLTSIGSYDLSSSNVYFNTSPSNVKTLKWANAYSYIYSEKKGWPWEGNNYLDVIYFSLFVDGVGKINPSDLNSVRFGFQDKHNDWVYINSSFNKKGSKDYKYSSQVGGQSMYVVNVEDAYYYDLSNPSRTTGLRSNFSADMYASESGIDSVYLNMLISQDTFKNWPSNEAYQFDYVLIMEHAPKLNSGAVKGNSDVNSFELVQFSYYENGVDLIGASMYDTPNPIYVIQDENGNDVVITINENGEIINSDDYSVGYYGVVIDNETGEEVHAHEHNFNKANPDNSFWDNILPGLSKLGNTIKTILTIALGIIALLVLLKIISLVVNIFKNKK